MSGGSNLLKILGASAALMATTVASAAPVCTTQPQARWMSQAQMRERITRMGYQKVKLFQVSGSCYEVYARTRDGRRAEVYFNPVTGAIVQNDIG
ncbi:MULTISPECIES: PepSY domain-containing protein [Sphingomonadaceae]|jgi:hypothetical protein|uniref:PepSY domain-containing protein n=1 Tax=Sphingomonadales TaxID=204457 RepID=UPI0004B63D6B|nr:MULTISPECIES: PepSY domain-containing protein [Sphingomonadaceae]